MVMLSDDPPTDSRVKAITHKKPENFFHYCKLLTDAIESDLIPPKKCKIKYTPSQPEPVPAKKRESCNPKISVKKIEGINFVNVPEPPHIEINDPYIDKHAAINLPVSETDYFALEAYDIKIDIFRTRIKKSEIYTFFKNEGLSPSLPTPPSQIEQKSDIKYSDDVIEKICFSIESDTEVKIDAPGKKSLSFKFEQLGLSTSGRKVHLTEFLNFLHYPEHRFKRGSSLDKKKYNTLHKRLAEIDKKLLAFFSKPPYNYIFSRKCSFFANVKGEEEHSSKKRKFLINHEVTHGRKSTETLLKEYETLLKKMRTACLENNSKKISVLADEIVDLSMTLLEKKIISNSKVIKDRLFYEEWKAEHNRWRQLQKKNSEQNLPKE